MENINRWLVPINTALIAVLFVFALAGGGGQTVIVPSNDNNNLSGQTRISGMHILEDGLLVDGSTVFDGLATLNAGQLRSNSIATSTGSATMDVQYLNGYDTVIVHATGAASAKTLTFFASSTASTWLPTAGDMQETCFLNATTTAGVNLVFAAGTGIDLQVATSSSNSGPFDLTIAPDATGCFKFIRKASTATAFDIEANLVEFSNAD